MSQSNAIAGAIALAFLVFITLRGELPLYLRLFKPAPVTTTNGGGGGGISKDDVKTAYKVAEFAATVVV